MEEGERDGLPFGPPPTRGLLGPVGHAYPGVHRLVAPQVVVVLELLVADGADVGRPGRPRGHLHCTRTEGERAGRDKSYTVSQRHTPP